MRIPIKSVVPAALTPFGENNEIDFSEFCRHVKCLSAVDGVTAIMVNGAAGQDHTMPRKDKAQLLRESVEAVEGKTPIIAAVRESEFESDISLLARDAEEAGAEAILVMPPYEDRDRTIKGATTRFKKVFDNADLPVAFYQVNPSISGYPLETLVELVKHDRVFAVKEGCGDPVTSKKEMRAMRDVDPGLAIWSTHSRWLLADLAMGADGLLSGMGSISADLHVALCRAIWRSDLTEARNISDVLFPLTQVFYGPGQNPHTRMKYALKKIGRLKNDYVRPPLEPLDTKERERIDKILINHLSES
jgi:4-hydroxy-tetrahydrodipicolinate synthase